MNGRRSPRWCWRVVVATSILLIGVAPTPLATSTSIEAACGPGQCDPWFAVRTPDGGFYQECDHAVTPYAAFGGIAGSVEHYYSPTNACVANHVPFGRPADYLGSRVEQYAYGIYLVGWTTWSYNSTGNNYAVTWGTVDPSATSCYTVAVSWQDDLHAYLDGGSYVAAC